MLLHGVVGTEFRLQELKREPVKEIKAQISHELDSLLPVKCSIQENAFSPT